jgi:hypothetical protein
MRERWMTLRVRLKTDAAPRVGDQIEPDRLIDFIESGEDLKVVGVTPTTSEMRSLCKKVRVETGARILDCKKALRACHWDVPKAIKWLQHRGQA